MSLRIEVQKISEGRYSLDVRGQVCPYPELLTLRALQNLSSGDILEVTLDNPPSIRDISIVIEKRGYGKPVITNIDNETSKIIINIPK
jgi:TusA-related sulfurtransferase